MRTPTLRVRCAADHPVNPEGDYVLYWMTAYRRAHWNFSLQRSVEWARQLNRPLVVLEALGCGYRWANDRLHTFLVQGMVDNALALQRKRVTYHPYVEPQRDAGQGLLRALAARACIVVSDDFPCFFLPDMYRAATRQVPVLFELIDSNGMLPMRAADKDFARAFDFRRFLQKNLADHLDDLPEPDPLVGSRLPVLAALPPAVTRRWPAARLQDNAGIQALVGQLGIDHTVAPSSIRGGARAAEKCLRLFLATKLHRYCQRNQPEEDAASGLSPYLHAGHLSAHQVFAEIMACQSWNRARLAEKADGSARGWWGVSEPVESFLDELITWREIGFNMCARRDDYDRYQSLPDWARRTLAKHATDPREFVYCLPDFEQAQTHDPLWNAAQTQLVREGRIHNYLRMLWGKKVLEWSASPQEALETLIELNNNYALDGRDPNSYSGIFWCLGRYDRAWGPERPIYGRVRYMSSENTARKVRVRSYLRQYGP